MPVAHSLPLGAASLREREEVGGLDCMVCGQKNFKAVHQLKRHFERLHGREMQKVQDACCCLSVSLCSMPVQHTNNITCKCMKCPMQISTLRPTKAVCIRVANAWRPLTRLVASRALHEHANVHVSSQPCAAASQPTYTEIWHCASANKHGLSQCRILQPRIYPMKFLKGGGRADEHGLSICQSVQRRSQPSRFKQWASANAEKVERFWEASDSVGRVPAQGYDLQRQLRRHGVQACAPARTPPLCKQSEAGYWLRTPAPLAADAHSKLPRAEGEAKPARPPL